MLTLYKLASVRPSLNEHVCEGTIKHKNEVNNVSNAGVTECIVKRNSSLLVWSV